MKSILMRTVVIAVMSAFVVGTAVPASAASGEKNTVARFVKAFWTNGPDVGMDAYRSAVARYAPSEVMEEATEERAADCAAWACETKPYRIRVARSPIQAPMTGWGQGDSRAAVRYFDVLFTTRGWYPDTPGPMVLQQHIGVDGDGHVVFVESPPSVDTATPVWNQKKKAYQWRPVKGGDGW